jgi:hypothetical protein
VGDRTNPSTSRKTSDWMNALCLCRFTRQLVKTREKTSGGHNSFVHQHLQSISCTSTEKTRSDSLPSYDLRDRRSAVVTKPTKECHGPGVSSARSPLRGSAFAAPRARAQPLGFARRAGPAGANRGGSAGRRLPGHRRLQAPALPGAPGHGHGVCHALGPRSKHCSAAGPQPAQLRGVVAAGASLVADGAA